MSRSRGGSSARDRRPAGIGGRAFSSGPRQGILDPQGQAVERALPALGFSGVSDVHVGRLIELDVEDPEQLSADVRAAARRTR